MTKDSLAVLVLVALVGVGAFGSLGRSMSDAIDVSTESLHRAATSVAVQAAGWDAVEHLARLAPEVADAELFSEWASVTADARRQLAWMGADLSELSSRDEPLRSHLALAAAEGPEAFERASNVIENARNLGQEKSDPGVQGVLAKTQARTGRVEVARRKFRDALDAARDLPRKARNYTRADIAFSQAEAGLVDDAYETLRGIDDAYLRSMAERVVEGTQTELEQATHRFLDAARTAGAEEFGRRIVRIKATGAWMKWLPADVRALETWGAALGEDWKSFADAPEALSALVRGATSVSSVLFGEDELLRFAAFATKELGLGKTEGLARHADVIDALSETRLAALQAERAMAAMALPEPKSLTRGLLVSSGVGNEAVRTLEDLVEWQVPVLALQTGRPTSVGDLARLFFAAGDERVIIPIPSFDAFARYDGEPRMVEALARLMDNHPRTMVVAESADPTKIHPMLRERGRFGPFYQGSAP